MRVNGEIFGDRNSIHFYNLQKYYDKNKMRILRSRNRFLGRYTSASTENVLFVFGTTRYVKASPHQLIKIQQLTLRPYANFDGNYLWANKTNDS